MNFRFFAWRSSSLYALSALIGLLAAVSPGSPVRTQHKAAAIPSRVTIEQNGFFYGEDQFYVVTPPAIHVYYQRSTGSNDSSNDVEQRPADDQLRSQWKGQEYYHEVFGLVHGKWTKKQREFSEKPNRHLNGNSCDSANKLDLPGGALRGALPRPIKIKDIEDRKVYAVVTYSDTPDQKEWYSLTVALLNRDPAGWHIVSTIYAGKNRQFCGKEAFRTRMRSGEEPLVLLLYSGESDPQDHYFVDIQSLLVREAKSRSLK